MIGCQLRSSVLITGFISQIDAGTIAQVVWRLGAGRDKPDDPIDHTVGIRLLKHVGEPVDAGKSYRVCT